MAVVALKAEAKGKATTKKKESGLGDEPLQHAMLRGPTAEDNPRMELHAKLVGCLGRSCLRQAREGGFSGHFAGSRFIYVRGRSLCIWT